MNKFVIPTIVIALLIFPSYMIMKSEQARAESIQIEETFVPSTEVNTNIELENTYSEDRNIDIVELSNEYNIQTEEDIDANASYVDDNNNNLVPIINNTNKSLCDISSSATNTNIIFNGEEISEEEFYFLSSVIEAESDRSENLEGRIYIALTILNRVNDDRFPDTITGVLTQSGQFSTVVNGHSIVEASSYSDQAIIEAIDWIEEGTAPNVLFFNCIGYNYGAPYGEFGGNYFMTLD